VTSDLKKALEGCSLVVVCTDHRKYSELSYEDLVKLAGRGLTVYDARGVMDRTKFPSDRLVRLGSGHKPS
jgi:UDP-N-acetyl-D-mannosaminuronate dehydrogenase